MKKTKIILPAIALLAVSGIASVTGTVAWFTAASSVNVTLSHVTALSTDANLNLALDNTSNGHWGCDLSGLAVTCLNLTDASFTPGTTNTCYKAMMNSETAYDEKSSLKSESGTVSSFYSVKENGTTNAKDGTQVYYTMRFNGTISSAAVNSKSTEEYDVFMNLSDLTNYSIGGATGSSAIKGAARVAVKTNSNVFVWAAHTTDTTVQHVTGTGTPSNTNLVAYTVSDTPSTGVHAIKGAKDKAGTASRATSKGNAGYLGTLTKTNTSIAVEFTVWFEGTDSSCVNAYAGDTLSGGLNFYAIGSSQYAAE